MDSEEPVVFESKVVATNRLRKEGRWDEASAFKDQITRNLRLEGQTKFQSSEAAWLAMMEKYPPLTEPVEPVVVESVEDVAASQAAFEALESAILSRPPLAGTEDELDWVMSHPKMRNREVEVTAADILDAPAGAAPSQRSCNMLIHCREPKQADKLWSAQIQRIFKAKPDVDEDLPDKTEELKKDVSYAQLHAELMEFGE